MLSRAIRPTRPLVFILGLALAATASAGDIHKLNGDIHVRAGQSVDAVKTVNGDIDVGEKATVTTVKSVNGDITLARQAHAETLKVVNGDVTLENDARVDDAVSTVNGDIHLESGADVHGHITNVRGDIRLDKARVGGGLETVLSDITVGAGSVVDGGIRVKKSRSDQSDFDDEHIPRIVIGPHAVVNGTLVFEREVKLYVSDSAKIGKVSGAHAQTFSGATP